jgi:hypothetical protein
MEAGRRAPTKGRADRRRRRQVVGDAGSKESIVELSAYPIEKPEGLNVIVGQAHFVKTVEDLHEALTGASPHLRFGIAFCEASGPSLIRRSGNEDDLVDLATRNAAGIGAGHSFIMHRCFRGVPAFIEDPPDEQWELRCDMRCDIGVDPVAQRVQNGSEHVIGRFRSSKSSRPATWWSHS